jgi:GAF domain-containing protein
MSAELGYFTSTSPYPSTSKPETLESAMFDPTVTTPNTGSSDQVTEQVPEPVAEQGSTIALPSPEQFQALLKILGQIRTSLELEVIFQTTASELRDMLNADRVGIFKFYPEQAWDGEFVAESLQAGLISALEVKVHDHCFGDQFAPSYAEGRIQAVSDIYAAGLSQCHADILAQFQVRANLAVPVLMENQLWGLLCIHQCDRPRTWTANEINFVQQVADHFSIAVQQAELVKTAQQQATQLEQSILREQAIAKTVEKIRNSLDINDIFHTTVIELRQLLNADRVGVFQFYPDKDWEGQFVAESVAQGWTSALEVNVYDHCFGEQFAPSYATGRIQAIADIYEAGLSQCHADILGMFQVKANLVVPVLIEARLWGLLCIHQCSGPRQWQTSEIDFVKQISQHFSVALRHHETLLDSQRQIEQQRTLTGVITRIRESLDLSTIFKTTVTEVRQLLQADRVGVFRFYPDTDWEGEFIAEDVCAQLPSAMQIKVHDYCFSEKFSSLYTQGRVHAISDIYQVGFKSCYLDILKQFQVRANVVAPMLQGDRLWGLLCIHQCDAPRHWKASEVEFVGQVAQQLGLALKQEDHLQQCQTQATQLAEAAERDKAMERQRLLSATVDKIRRSLDLDKIFKTTTDAVRELLDVDRVGIYHFDESLSGRFVADSMVDGSSRSQGHGAVASEIFLQPDDHGNYPRYETFVPIAAGENEKLWGLLVASQNAQPRYWQPQDIELLAQVGGQLGVAIQQAELLKHTKKQAEKLTQTLRNLQETQTQLIQGEKMASLGQLVAGVAHEINNPVNFIYGNAPLAIEQVQELVHLIKLYQHKYPDPGPEILKQSKTVDVDFVVGDLPKLLNSMQMGAERIREIVKSLRNFSRMDEAEIKSVDIHEGLDSTLLILKHRLQSPCNGGARAIEVIKTYGDLPIVKCYAGQLNQVFMNLLSNAIDALEETLTQTPHFRPKIYLRTEFIQDNVRIEIEDNGPGINQAAQDKLFDPFFTTKPVGKGTGLGLAISYQIVTEKHQGKIQCTSQLDKGTTFSVQIPLQPPANLAAPDSPPPGS